MVRVPLVLPLEHSQQNFKRNNKAVTNLYIPTKPPPRRESTVHKSQSHWTKKRQNNKSTQTCKECQTSPVVSKAPTEKDNIPCSELAGAQHILKDIQELLNHENDGSNDTGDSDLHLYDIDARLALEDIRQRHDHGILHTVLKAWRESCIHYKRELVETEMKQVQHFKTKRKSIVTALAGMTIGSSEEKKILNRRTNALKQARETLIKKLEAKNQVGGIITEAMLQVELQKIFHDEIQAWDRKRYLRPPFQWMKQSAREIHLLKEKADDYRRKRLLHHCIRDWRLRSAKSRQVHLRYSQMDVDAFIDKRRMKLSFKIWCKWSLVMALAKKLQRKILSRQVLLLFQSWSIEAKKRLRLKRTVLDKWMTHRHTCTTKGLQRWDTFSRYASCLEASKLQLVKAFSISKARRKKRKLFRHWLHVVMYGRVSSLYTRKQLLDQLEEERKKNKMISSSDFKI